MDKPINFKPDYESKYRSLIWLLDDSNNKAVRYYTHNGHNYLEITYKDDTINYAVESETGWRLLHQSPIT